MIKHVVLFQFKEFSSYSEKLEKLNEIKHDLEALTQKISVVEKLVVGVNINKDEEYDIVLEVTFNSFKDIDVYAKHPDHVAVGNIIRSILNKRACVDFEL